MNWTCARWLLLALLLLLPASEAVSQSRSETLLVVVELGPNSMDIHGVGANRPAYQASWRSRYPRVFGRTACPSGSR